MKANAIPTRMEVVWGRDAGGSYIRPVPDASQIGIQAGAASYATGFPPLSMTPTSLGGVPPFGQDFNGVMNQVTAWLQWAAQAGVVALFDNGFSNAIGGYPQGAFLQSAVTVGLFWLSTKDDNMSDPDAGGAGWVGIWPPIALTGNTTFYVSTTGNDSHSGLSSGQAWLTLQHAADVILARYNLNGFNASVEVADGTYAVGAEVIGQAAGAVGLGSFDYHSASGNSAACVVSCSANNCFTAHNGGDVKIQNIRLVNSGGNGLFAFDGGSISHVGCDFGPCSASQIIARTGSRITSSDDYKITGAAAAHMTAAYGGVIRQSGSTITLTGTPAYSGAFAQAVSLGCITFQASPAFSGAATGTRYSAVGAGVIDVNGAGATYLPGNGAGSVANGGVYY